MISLIPKLKIKNIVKHKLLDIILVLAHYYGHRFHLTSSPDNFLYPICFY